MQTDQLKILQDTDLLGIVIARHGKHHTAKNYVDLFQLAGINKKWREVIAQNVAGPLREDAARFMLDIAMLYQSGNFSALVQGLLHFHKMKDHSMQLYGVTALHVACSTAHHMRETRIIKQIATAGGVEAVIGSMVMNTACLPLNIVCTRMLAKLSQYRNIDAVTWGWWTPRQSKTAVQVILDAMREFPLSLDMQCCGMSCLVQLCSWIRVPHGDKQIVVCKQNFRQQGGLSLAVAAMHAHNHATLHVDICKLIALFHHEDVTWEEIRGTHGNNVLQLALQNSVAPGAQLESTFILTELITTLCHETTFLENACQNPLTISVCLRVLQRVCAHIDTETPADAIENQKIIRATVLLLKRILMYSERAVRQFLLFPNSNHVLLQVLSASHELLMAPPPLLFNSAPRITYDSCYVIQFSICQCLLEVASLDVAENLFHADALRVLFSLIGETTNEYARRVAIQVVHRIAIRDNAQSLHILRAGGLPTLANMLRRIGTTDRETTRCALLLLNMLAAYPVYATAMLDLGFGEIIEHAPNFENTDIFLAQLQTAENNPVYP